MTNSNRTQRASGFLFPTIPKYGKTPQALILDRRVSDKGCRLYALIDAHCKEKDFKKKRYIWYGQQTLANELGCSRPWLNHLIKELYDAGWIEVQRRGWRTSIITPLPYPKRRTQQES